VLISRYGRVVLVVGEAFPGAVALALVVLFSLYAIQHFNKALLPVLSEYL
jgi:hypothetical protein